MEDIEQEMIEAALTQSITGQTDHEEVVFSDQPRLIFCYTFLHQN